MRMRVGQIVKALTMMCELACACASAMAQEPIEADLSAKQRVLLAVGPGLRAIKQGTDGRLYVLASPSPGLLVFDKGGKQVLSINEVAPSAGAASASQGLIGFGEDCDVDAEGKIYVADHAANAIRVFSAEGAP